MISCMICFSVIEWLVVCLMVLVTVMHVAETYIRNLVERIKQWLIF